jgi:hypothetical protein
LSIALHGNLKDFGIAEVFQLIGQQRKTGLLEIAEDDERVELAFDEGAVVWATPIAETEFAVLGDRLVRCGLITRSRLAEMVRESQASARPLPSLLLSSGAIEQADLEEINELLSRETIFDVMRWTGGSFHFKAQPIHHDVAPDKLLAAEQILMDGLRMLDEWQTFKNLVPEDDTIFERAGQIEVYRQKLGGDARSPSDQVDRIFQLVDGRLTVRRVIDLSRLGTFDATRILADLLQAGVIRALAESAAKQIRKPAKTSRPLGARIRVALAAVLPLALLAAMVYVQFAGRTAPTRVQGVAIPSSPLADTRQNFELRRMIYALQARRLLTGEWPADLSHDSIEGVREGFALTESTSHPYYYVERDGGILLLSPSH